MSGNPFSVRSADRMALALDGAAVIIGAGVAIVVDGLLARVIGPVLAGAVCGLVDAAGELIDGAAEVVGTCDEPPDGTAATAVERPPLRKPRWTSVAPPATSTRKRTIAARTRDRRPLPRPLDDATAPDPGPAGAGGPPSPVPGEGSRTTG